VPIHIVYNEAVVPETLLFDEFRHTWAHRKAIVIENNHAARREPRPDPLEHALRRSVDIDVAMAHPERVVSDSVTGVLGEDPLKQLDVPTVNRAISPSTSSRDVSSVRAGSMAPGRHGEVLRHRVAATDRGVSSGSAATALVPRPPAPTRSSDARESPANRNGSDGTRTRAELDRCTGMELRPAGCQVDRALQSEVGGDVVRLDRQVGSWVLPRHDDTALTLADHVPQETLFWRRRVWEAAGGYLDESFGYAIAHVAQWCRCGRR
jgi:hypothetical protein